VYLSKPVKVTDNNKDVSLLHNLSNFGTLGIRDPDHGQPLADGTKPGPSFQL